ncbi:hypothetical protein FOMPIDRAFT_1025944, partial [Fomitopsis schrenkii]
MRCGRVKCEARDPWTAIQIGRREPVGKSSAWLLNLTRAVLMHASSTGRVNAQQLRWSIRVGCDRELDRMRSGLGEAAVGSG